MADRLKLSAIRAKFPMYSDLSDDQLLIGVHKAYYPDIPIGQFTQRVDYDTQAAAMDPTKDMSTFDKVMAGAGKSVADTGRGIGQLTGLANQQEVDEAAARDKALMATTEGTVGNIGGQIAQMAVGGGAVGAGAKALGAANVAAKAGAAAPYLTAAAQSGGFAALQPVETGDSRLGNVASAAAMGGAGQAVSSGLGRVAKGASDKITPNIRALYDKAVALGIPVRVDQLGDSTFLKTLASQLEKLPLTGATKSQEAQQIAFNRAVSRRIGQDADHVTPEVYAAAKQRLGSTFEDLTSRNNLQVGDDLVGKLAAITDEAKRFGQPDVANAIANLADDILGKVEGGAMPGRAYQSMDSLMGKLSKSGGEKAHYLGQLRETLRNGMDSSITDVDRAAWDAARGQYKALKTITPLVAKDPAGNISPAALAGRIASNNAGKEAMASGRAGELGDIAMIGRQFVRDPVPNSGTAQRLFATLALPGIGAGAGYASNSDGSSVGNMLAGAALAAGGGRVVNRTLNSPAAARYLMNGAAPAAQTLLRAGRAAPYLLPAAANAAGQD